MSDYIETSIKEGVLCLKLNRPEKKNALDIGMYQTLADSLVEADNNPDVRVIFISGEGDAFCSGNDLKDFLENTPENLDAPVFQFMNAIARAEKPIVVAVNGLAVGIGTTMLLHCDLVYSDETARFILPFVQLGVCAEAGSSLLLPMLLGKQKASELLMTGEPLLAREANELGLVNQILASNDLHDTAFSKAALIAKQPVNALLATKRLLKQPIKSQLDDVIRKESQQFLELLQQEESKKIMAAFLSR